MLNCTHVFPKLPEAITNHDCPNPCDGVLLEVLIVAELHKKFFICCGIEDSFTTHEA